MYICIARSSKDVQLYIAVTFSMKTQLLKVRLIPRSHAPLSGMLPLDHSALLFGMVTPDGFLFLLDTHNVFSEFYLS